MRTSSIADELQRLLSEALRQGIIADAVVAANEAQADAFWNIRDSISEAERSEGRSCSRMTYRSRLPICRAS